MKTLIIVTLLLLFFQSAVFSENSSQIHNAARDGNLETLISLAQADPDSLYSFCSMGKTPLHWATGKNHPEIVKVLLERFKMPADTRNANQGTPLHVAASQAQYNCAKILIAHGADLNSQAKDGATPLHFACFKGKKQGHIDCIKLLLEKGCDANPQMKNGVTPMNIAVKRNNSEVIKILKTYGGKAGIIDGSVKMGRYDFAGGTAYKTSSNNINRPNNQTSSNFSSKNTNMNNNTKGSMNISFSQRKKMMLQRFDANDDGILDESERLKAKEFMKNRMQQRQEW